MGDHTDTNVEQEQTNVEQTQKDLYLNFGNDNTVNLILFSDKAYITTAVEAIEADDDGNADGNTV